MKKICTHVLPILFLICFIVIVINAALARPRVLIVMSYNQDNPWEQEIRKGVELIFNKQAPHYLVNYFYLNTLNNSSDDIQRNVNTVINLIETWRPQVLILSNDNAQELIGKKYLDRPDISIVFNGVNANPALYGYKPKRNVTGIIENLHYDSMRQALQLMFPNYLQFIHLSDNSQTSQYVNDQLLDFDWQPLKIIRSVKTKSLSTWMKTIQNANEKNALLLLTHFDSIYDHGRLVSPKEIMDLTLQKAHVPIFDFFDFTVSDGVPMALSTSSLDQGSTAAKLTMRIINDNEKAGDIPFARSKYFNFAINKHSIDINMPQVIIPEVYKSLAYLNNSTRLTE